MNLTVIKHHMGWHIKEDRKGGVCSMHGSGMHTRFYGECEGIHSIPHLIKLDCSDMEYNDVDWIHLD